MVSLRLGVEQLRVPTRDHVRERHSAHDSVHSVPCSMTVRAGLFLQSNHLSGNLSKFHTMGNLRELFYLDLYNNSVRASRPMRPPPARHSNSLTLD